MKNFLLLATLLLASAACFGQTSWDAAGCPVQRFDSPVITVSGTLFSVRNDCGAFRMTFAYDITGGPATVSTVISGCMRGLAPCAVLETSTVATSAIHTPTFTIVYDYFTVVPSWTGGTGVTFTIHSLSTTAENLRRLQPYEKVAAAMRDLDSFNCDVRTGCDTFSDSNLGGSYFKPDRVQPFPVYGPDWATLLRARDEWDADQSSAGNRLDLH